MQNSIIGASRHRAHIKFQGLTIGEEVPSDIVKGVGRQHNMLDNMSRKFTIKGFSPKTKLNMWDLMTLHDVEQKK